MNIHFKDESLFVALKKATLFTSLIGSKMYGTSDENSDTDYLSIYVPSISERNSYCLSHHQLQYKKDGVDYNFVNIFTFIRNTLNGDSPINFEIINNKLTESSNLQYLYNSRIDFYNYKIIKSYLGMCRRDLKYMSKEPTEIDKNKKLAHVLRGLEFPKMILNKNFDPVISYELKERIFEIKSIKDSRIRHEISETLTKEVSDFREKVNKILDSRNDSFPYYMYPDKQKSLDNWLNSLINSEIWKDKENWFMDLSSFYDTFEKPELRYD